MMYDKSIVIEIDEQWPVISNQWIFIDDFGKVNDDYGSKVSDIPWLMSVINDIHQSFWIQCWQPTCQAQVSAASSYKCAKCNFNHWENLGKIISRESDAAMLKEISSVWLKSMGEKS